ncbi:MAG: lipid-A-disaccharide synthase [Bdellovibrionales bacterium]
MKKLFIIAGEASGDLLAADLIKEFKGQYPQIKIYGIGGSQSLASGLNESLFPMEELSIMGVFEILPKIPKMLKRINQTVQEIKRVQPDIVISIDSPDFSFRVQKKVKKQGINTKQVHYVAPTVWAWRERRAKKIAKFLDGILCLFPFEPPYFERAGLKATYIGHPAMKRYEQAPTPEEAKQKLGFTKEDGIIGLLLGSRRGELKRHAEIFLKATQQSIEENTKVLVPTLPHLRESVEELVKTHASNPEKFIIVDKPEEQTTYFKAMDKALAVSGTVGLELAIAGTPHVIGYRVSWLTALIVKKLIKTKYIHLANIILDRKVVPECIQDDCNTQTIATQLKELKAKEQKDALNELINIMKTIESPSKTAISFIKSL